MMFSSSVCKIEDSVKQINKLHYAAHIFIISSYALKHQNVIKRHPFLRTERKIFETNSKRS